MTHLFVTATGFAMLHENPAPYQHNHSRAQLITSPFPNQHTLAVAPLLSLVTRTVHPSSWGPMEGLDVL